MLIMISPNVAALDSEWNALSFLNLQMYTVGHYHEMQKTGAGGWQSINAKYVQEVKSMSEKRSIENNAEKPTRTKSNLSPETQAYLLDVGQQLSSPSSTRPARFAHP